MRGIFERAGRLGLALVVAASVIAAGTAVYAHECESTDSTEGTDDGKEKDKEKDKEKTKDEGGDGCEDTSVAPNWRDPYVPLFTLQDHEDEEERREAQRWRDEWGCESQHCTWADNNTSVDGGSPGSVHAGTAADHSMFEVAHQSEDHGSTEANHDAHGGAVFADVCLSSDEGTSYEDQAGACEGTEDTQVGVVLMDHNACGNVLPYVSCTDEYHIVRPLDSDYTMDQMQGTQEGLQTIQDDPRRYLCGYGPGSEGCVVPVEVTDALAAALGGVPTGAVTDAR